MIPRICIQPSISSGTPTPVLWSEIEQAMRDPRIQDICDQIKLLDGKDPDELARLKRQLPVITPHACRFRGDGSRKSDNAVPSGLVMLDIDHIDNPRDFFSTHIFPHLNSEASEPSELLNSNRAAVYFVAITPSGHGLRIIAERNPGESIPEAQSRIADLCNLPEFDAVTKDLARASYLMPWSYVLYCEPSGLDFKDEDHLHKITATCQVPAVTSAGDPAFTPYTLHPTPATSPLPNSAASPSRARELIGAEVVDIVFNKESPIVVSEYKGIPYEAIVKELVQLLGGFAAQ